eukprot:Lankesteria_metandrocarpae@DN1010_c0_g1_i2.p1
MHAKFNEKKSDEPAQGQSELQKVFQKMQLKRAESAAEFEDKVKLRRQESDQEFVKKQDGEAHLLKQLMKKHGGGGSKAPRQPATNGANDVPVDNIPPVDTGDNLILDSNVTPEPEKSEKSDGVL